MKNLTEVLLWLVFPAKFHLTRVKVLSNDFITVLTWDPFLEGPEKFSGAESFDLKFTELFFLHKVKKEQS